MRFLLTVLFCGTLFVHAQKPLPTDVVEEAVMVVDPDTYEIRATATPQTEPVPAGTPYPDRAKNYSSGRFKGFVSKGVWVVSPTFLELPKEYAPEGMVAKAENGYFGLIDGFGRTLIPFEYRELSKLHQPENYPGPLFFKAKRGGLTGLLDVEGKEILPFVHSYISHERRGIHAAHVSVNGRGIKLFDGVAGKLLYPERVKFGFIDLPDGRMLITTAEGSFLINRAGEKKSAVYEKLRFVPNAGDKAHTPVLVVGAEGAMGILSLDERELLPIIYRNLYPGKNGNFVVENAEGKKGLYHLDKGFILKPGYDGIRGFDRNPYYIIEVNAPGGDYGGKRGVVDKNGKVILPPEYEQIEDVGTGIFAVGKGSGKRLFNSEDGTVGTSAYTSVRALAPGYAIVERFLTPEEYHASMGKKRKYAVLDLRTSRLLTDYRYDSVSVSGRKADYRLIATRDGFRGTLTAFGHENHDFVKIRKRN